MLPSRSASCGADDLGGAAGIEAVDEGRKDADFGGLAVRVSGEDAVCEGFRPGRRAPLIERIAPSGGSVAQIT
jgi:hypothetical protein